MSRKKQVNQKITALYCRISLEDGGDNESMSIGNQKIMLRDFAEKNGMFQYEYYVDDGYTGRNFNRPSFQRMIADIEAGKIGCVITKDLSRLGRNYIEAGSTTIWPPAARPAPPTTSRPSSRSWNLRPPSSPRSLKSATASSPSAQARDWPASSPTLVPTGSSRAARP